MPTFFYKWRRELSIRKQSITEGALVLTISLAIVKIVSLIYKFPLIELLAGGGWAYYQSSYNIYGAVYAIAVVGFPVAVSRLVAGYSASGRYKDVVNLRRESLKLFAVIGVIGAVCLMLLAKPITASITTNRYAHLCVVAVAPSIFFSCVMSSYRGYYQGLSNMVPTAMSDVVEVLFKAAFGYGTAYLLTFILRSEFAANGTVLGVPETSASAMSSILAIAAAGAISSVTISTGAAFLSLVIFYRRRGGMLTEEQIESSPEPERLDVLRKQILRYGFPLALSAITLRVASLIDDMTVIRSLINAMNRNMTALLASHKGLLEMTGVQLSDMATYLYEVYGYCIPLYDLVPTITANFATSALPHITAALGRGDKEQVKKHIETMMGITMLIAAPAGLGMAFMAEPLLNFLYPSLEIGAILAAPMLSVLGISAIAVCLASFVNMMFQAIGRIDLPVKLMAVGCAIKILVNCVLVSIPSLNIKAVPVTTLICYVTISAIGMVIITRETGVKTDLVKTIVKPMLAGTAAGFAARMTYILLSGAVPSKISTLAGCLVAVIVYAVLAMVLKLLTREIVESLPGGRKIAAALEKIHMLG